MLIDVKLNDMPLAVDAPKVLSDEELKLADGAPDVAFDEALILPSCVHEVPETSLVESEEVPMDVLEIAASPDVDVEELGVL